jgi:DNA repair protein RAD50
MSVDRLEGLNKTIERYVIPVLVLSSICLMYSCRYVRGKRARLLSECATRIEELDNEIADLNVKLDETRVEISNIDKIISESGAFVGNLRENIRVRKLIKDIAATQAEIATYDLDEAAKAKRIFDEKYSVEKQKETDLHAEVRR